MDKLNSNRSFYEQETEYKIQAYYRIKTVAKMLDVSEKTVKRMIYGGEIKAKRFAGCIRIPYSEVVKNIKEY